MATPSNHQSQTDAAFRDFTRTPHWLFQAFNLEFGYHLDAAALPESALLPNYLTPADDALTVDWSAHLSHIDRPCVWLNPPYSDIAPWIEKAIEQQKKGVTTTLLVPHDNRTNWWPSDTASEIRDIVGYYETLKYQSGALKGMEYKKWRSGGIKFINAKTGKEMENELNKPICLIVFRPFHDYPTAHKSVRKDALMALGSKALKG